MAPSVLTAWGRGGCCAIDSFLLSWGWQLGKHSAVDNSAYVHFSRGLWVSQKGPLSACVLGDSREVSCMVMAASAGGATRAQMLRSRGAGLPSSPVTQAPPGHRAATPQPLQGPPVSASPSNDNRAHRSPSNMGPKGSSALLFAPEEAGLRGRGDGVPRRATACCASLRARSLACPSRVLAGLENYKHLALVGPAFWCTEASRGGKPPTARPPSGAPFVHVVECTCMWEL